MEESVGRRYEGLELVRMGFGVLRLALRCFESLLDRCIALLDVCTMGRISSLLYTLSPHLRFFIIHHFVPYVLSLF